MRKAAAMLGLGTACAWPRGAALRLPSTLRPQEVSSSRPTRTGWVDRSATDTTGIQGQWHAFADERFGAPRSDCETTAFGECCIVHEPAPGSTYAPTPGLGMCASGSSPDSTGSRGLSHPLSPWVGRASSSSSACRTGPEPRASVDPPAGQPYDAVAHGVTGFAFDIDSEPGSGTGLLVTTVGPGESFAESAPIYWGGAHLDASPVHAGHNEFHWNEVGPESLRRDSNAPRVGFLVAGNDSAAVSYAFCIDNLTALRSVETNPRSGSAIGHDSFPTRAAMSTNPRRGRPRFRARGLRRPMA